MPAVFKTAANEAEAKLKQQLSKQALRKARRQLEMVGKEPKKLGRLSVYSEAIATEICQRIAAGESLVQISADEHMPTRSTIMLWLATLDKYENFRTAYARARTDQADAMDARIMSTVDELLEGKIDPHTAKVAIGAFQWRASKLKPKVYGDRLEVETSVTMDLGNLINEARKRAELRAGAIDTTASHTAND